MRSERLIVALDFAKETEAKALVRTLKKDVAIFKVGLQLYTRAGPSIIKAIQKTEHKIFLDLKFHDIPTTVAKAVMEATQHGVFMLTVHALGGKEMMERAVVAAEEAAEQLSLLRPKIMAVTVLTSLRNVGEIGIQASVSETVVNLAKMAQEAGCDGVVCSPREISMIREACGGDFLIVTPGIRLGDEDEDDQQRVDTPRAAFLAGANYIVVGRPITKATDPVVAVRKITASIHGLDPSQFESPAPELEEIQAEEAEASPEIESQEAPEPPEFSSDIPSDEPLQAEQEVTFSESSTVPMPEVEPEEKTTEGGEIQPKD